MPPLVTVADAISELEKMLSPRIRHSAEVDRRTAVFRALAKWLRQMPAETEIG